LSFTHPLPPAGHIRGVGFGLASPPDEALLVPANNKDDFVTQSLGCRLLDFMRRIIQKNNKKIETKKIKK